MLLACGGAPPRTMHQEEAQEEARPYVVALRFEDAGEDTDDTPHTRVLLVRIAPAGRRTVRELSIEPGACYHEHERGALIAARCWWGAQSARYLVERRGEALIALRGESSDEPREVVRLDLPRDARLQVLLPDAAASSSPASR
jgi:hypothetical protein